MKETGLDNIISDVLNKEARDLKPSRDIFSSAWVDKDKKADPKSFPKRGRYRRLPIAAACVLSFFMVMTMVSPATKTIAMEIYDNIRTIFVYEDNEVVAKTEDEVYDFEHLGSIKIDHSNKSTIEKNLELEFNFPNEFENYRIQGRASAGITIFDVHLKDIEELRDTFLASVLDEDMFNELDRFEMNRHVSAHYSDSDHGNFNIYINKHKLELFPNMNVTKTIKRNDIELKFVESTRAFYPRAYNENWVYEDMTKRPKKIVQLEYLIWEEDGMTYSVTDAGSPGEAKLNIDEAVKFIDSYRRLDK